MVKTLKILSIKITARDMSQYSVMEQIRIYCKTKRRRERTTKVKRRWTETGQSNNISTNPLGLICQKTTLNGKIWKLTLILILQWAKWWEDMEKWTKMMNSVPLLLMMVPQKARQQTWPKYCHRSTRNRNQLSIKLEEGKASSTAFQKMLNFVLSNILPQELKLWTQSSESHSNQMLSR